MDDDLELTKGLEHLDAQAVESEISDFDSQPTPGPLDPEPQPAPPAIQTGEAMTLLVATVTNVLAARRGQHWKLAPEESQAVGEAYGAVIDAWMPADQVGPPVMAIMVSAVVFGPRIAEDRALARARAETPPKKDTDQSTDGQQGSG